jgi:ribosomal 30S subunit maturation factor RimM
MILLDENINEDQRALLEQWKIKTRQIGVDVETKGISDENIIAALHGFRGILFVSRDSDFFKKEYCFAEYCIVYLDVDRNETAYYIRKFLKHEMFDTMKKRLGKVIKINQSVFSFYQIKSNDLIQMKW